MSKIIKGSFSLVLFATLTSSYANVAQITALKGNAVVVRNNYSYLAENGMLLEKGDIVRCINGNVKLQYPSCVSYVPTSHEVRLDAARPCPASRVARKADLKLPKRVDANAERARCRACKVNLGKRPAPRRVARAPAPRRVTRAPARVIPKAPRPVRPIYSTPTPVATTASSGGFPIRGAAILAGIVGIAALANSSSSDSSTSTSTSSSTSQGSGSGTGTGSGSGGGIGSGSGGGGIGSGSGGGIGSSTNPVSP